MDNNIDKWGSLSMPERASLISLFTGSGVTSLDEMRALYNEYGNGGGIHIDPSKRGTFTSAAKRHGMGVQEFASRVLSNKDDYSTAMVRKANFAINAAKWHESGGWLDNGVKTGYQFNDVLLNKSVDTIQENANYAAYGDDLRDAVYVPTDFSAVVNPSGTPEYTAEIVGRPYISLDIDKYNRSQIKHIAQNAASGDEAAMYFNGDDRGTIMPSSDNKWRRRVFKRAF